MRRRDFLKAALPAAVLPVALGGYSLRALARNPIIDALMPQADCSDRTLVLIQLFGGNDGLNTVIPLDQYDRLQPARPEIIVPEKDIIKLTDTVGLHSALTGFRDLYNKEQLAIIQSVGYPVPNLSHFRSTDIWTTASDYNQYVSTGWMGRFLELEYPNYPFGYPNDAMPDPLAIQIGSILSPTLDGTLASMGMAFTNLNRYFNVDTDDTTLASTRAGELEGFVRSIGEQVNKFGVKVQNTANSTTIKSSLWPPHRSNPLADQLKIAAMLICGGLKSRVYLVTLGGFDTHYSQNSKGNSGQPFTHPQLLELLQDAIAAFLDELERQDKHRDVLGMTFSEFGRRIKSNSSEGTDHGAAGPQFVFGHPVQGGIIGANPIIADKIEIEDNLPMAYDFRSMYATVLKDWFCADDARLNSVLFKDFPTLPFIRGGGSSVSPSATMRNLQVTAVPNPFISGSLIRVQIPAGVLRVSVFNAIGAEVLVLHDAYHGAGIYEATIDGNGLASGSYYVRVQSGNQVTTTGLIRK